LFFRGKYRHTILEARQRAHRSGITLGGCTTTEKHARVIDLAFTLAFTCPPAEISLAPTLGCAMGSRCPKISQPALAARPDARETFSSRFITIRNTQDKGRYAH
jgi:hypothetical protein